MNHPMRTLLLIFGICLLLPGCSIVEEAVGGAQLPGVTPEGQTLEQAGKHSAYPDKALLGEPLDIHIIRGAKTIRIDNRTPRVYRNVQIWLNHEYGASLGDLNIGQSEAYNLQSFINHHGESYPIGTFLRPELDRKLVMVDLFVDGKIHKCVVRLTKDWQLP